jgi:DNA-binding winged helix-turn-helix (wHTH) protein
MTVAVKRIGVDWNGGILKYGEMEIKLSGQEKALLQYLSQQADTTLSKEDLIRKIWGDNSSYIDELYLTQLIYRLRKSLCAIGLNDHIMTVPRKGYRFTSESLVLAPYVSTSLPEAAARLARGVPARQPQIGFDVRAASPPVHPDSTVVQIDEEHGVARHDQIVIKLTRLELRLLRIFIERPDAVLSKTDLIVGVWGSQGSADDGHLTQLISRLRRALRPLGLNEAVVTIPHMGYRFNGSVTRGAPVPMNSVPQPAPPGRVLHGIVEAALRFTSTLHKLVKPRRKAGDRPVTPVDGEAGKEMKVQIPTRVDSGD